MVTAQGTRFVAVQQGALQTSSPETQKFLGELLVSEPRKAFRELCERIIEISNQYEREHREEVRRLEAEAQRRAPEGRITDPYSRR